MSKITWNELAHNAHPMPTMDTVKRYMALLEQQRVIQEQLGNILAKFPTFPSQAREMVRDEVERMDYRRKRLNDTLEYLEAHS